MTTEASAVEHRRVQLVAQEHAEEGDHEAEQRRGVLEQHGEQARVLAVVDGGERARARAWTCGTPATRR